MSPHTQFWLVTILSTLLTGPFLMLAWRRGFPSRRRMQGYYLAGYGLIVATLIVDSFINPPLLLHGFFPGIGCGLILTAIGHYLIDAHQMAKPAKSASATE
ncbi:MAG TPA: hypothetical protein VF792_01295 [Ktedonobacterales bacterium]